MQKKTFFVTSWFAIMAIIFISIIANDNYNVNIKNCEEKVIIKESLILRRPVLKDLEKETIDHSFAPYHYNVEYNN